MIPVAALNDASTTPGLDCLHPIQSSCFEAMWTAFYTVSIRFKRLREEKERESGGKEGKEKGSEPSGNENSKYTVAQNVLLRVYVPRAGSGVERIDPLRSLDGCRKRRLNQALSVLSFSLVF